MAGKKQTEHPRIFISYSRQDAAVMRRLEARLKAVGADVWVDHQGIRSGDNLPKRISDALEWCSVLLLLWSASAKASKWVEDEWTNAHSLGRRIIPCLVDATPRPGILASKVYVDFREIEEGLAELLHSLSFSQPSAAPAIAPQPEREPRLDHGRLTDAVISTKPKSPHALPVVQLRSKPRVNFSNNAVQKMLRKHGFYDAFKNKNGKGARHEYETIERQGQKLIIDHATGLTWQQSGSKNQMVYLYSEKYVEQLRKEKFAGYDDWRLPTLEEAMSLMESSKKNGDLYIDQVFDKMQWWIWTEDERDHGVAWVVFFDDGHCNDGHLDLYSSPYVRAVR